MFLVLSLGTVIIVYAENSTTANVNANAGTSAAVTAPMMVNIGPNGNVMLRGTIVGTPGADSLVVKSWGGSWTVNVLSTTNVMSVNKALTDFKEGDIVGVLGSIAADGDFAIDAKILRAWGHRLDDDHDGIPNNQDNDNDNDGINNNKDVKPNDHDNDGTIDSLDTDDDNDGILDTEDTKPLDANNDGIPDGRERHHGRDPLKKMMEKIMDNSGSKNMEVRGSDSSHGGSNEDNSGSGRDN